MKRFTRCTCLLVAIVMLLASSVFAAEEAAPRASSFFMSSSVYLWKTSGTTFQAWFDVTALRTMDELGASVIKVQRSSDGENWTTMKTFTKESYSNLICKNTAGHSSYITYTGTSGFYYRAYIELYAKDSSGTGYVSRYTSSMKLT